MKKISLLCLMLTSILLTGCVTFKNSQDNNPITDSPDIDYDDDNINDDSNDDDSNDESDIITPPDVIDPSRVEMSELEVRDYLEDRTFVITTFNSGGTDWKSYGSGWLFDEGQNYWYIATNRHVIKDYNENIGDELCVSNKWDQMRTYYDFDTATGVDIIENKNVMTDTALVDVAYTNCMNAEIIYSNTAPSGNNAHDYYDFAVLKIEKSATSTYIPNDITPLVLKTAENIDNDLGIGATMAQVYNLSSGRGRWGSFFNNSKALVINDREAGFWSPNVTAPSESHNGGYNLPLDTGSGSSGSAFVDSYGEVVGISTYNFGYAWPITESEASHNPYNKKSMSGTSSVGIMTVIVPEYLLTLTEETILSN